MGDVQPAFEDTQPVAKSEEQPAFEDTNPVVAKHDEQPAFEDTEPVKESESLGQRTLTGIEGVGNALTGNALPKLASKMREGASAIGVPDKYLDYVAPSENRINQRAQSNPLTAEAGNLGGNIAAVAALPEFGFFGAGAEGAGLMAKAGSGAINGAMQMGLLQAKDEAGKYIMGQGDPSDAVATNILGSAGQGLLIGGILGGASKIATDAANKIAETKVGSKMASWLSGVGFAAKNPGAAADAEAFLQQPLDKDLFHAKSFRNGQEFYHGLIEKTVETTLPSAIGGLLANHYAPEGQKGWRTLEGVVVGAALRKQIDSLAMPVLNKISEKVVAPIFLKMASSGSFQGLAKAINHGKAISKGIDITKRAIEPLFIGGAHDMISPVDGALRDKFKKFIDEGGIDSQLMQEQQNQSQGLAEGGEVKPMHTLSEQNPIAHHWPEQNMLLSAAKGRVSNYLKASKPMNGPSQFTYDTEHKDPQKEREYDKTVDLAISPLTILKHVKDGSLTPKQMKDFVGMYPEIHQYLSKQITKRAFEGKMKEEKKPPYHVRQAMSLFLGSSLDSSMTPQSIQAAQAVFVNQKQQQQMPPENTKSSLSKMSQAAKTPEQAREERLNKA